jgi:copper(I)-binding protein
LEIFVMSFRHALALLLTLAPAVPALAQSQTPAPAPMQAPPSAAPAKEEIPITVSEAWARPAAKGGSDVVYLTLTNHAKTPERLIRAASPIARMTMLHTTKMAAGGVMQMRDVEGIDLPPGKSVSLAPGGLHIMLSGLEQTLKPGQTLPLTLTFASGREITLLVPVRQGPAGQGDGMSGHEMGGHEMSGHQMGDMPGMSGH